MESIKTSIIAPPSQQDRETEAQVFQIWARAGVCCIGIQCGFGITPDYVLFQPVVTTLAVPLATFANPDEAIAAIKAKLAQSGFPGGAEWRGDSVQQSQPQPSLPQHSPGSL